MCTNYALFDIFSGKFVVSMDMFDSESFDNKLDLRNDEVSIAKGEWLHLEMNLRTVVHQGPYHNLILNSSFLALNLNLLTPIFRYRQFDCRAVLGHPSCAASLPRAKNWRRLPQHPYGTDRCQKTRFFTALI